MSLGTSLLCWFLNYVPGQISHHIGKCIIMFFSSKKKTGLYRYTEVECTWHCSGYDVQGCVLLC